MYDMGMKVAAVSLMCQDKRVWSAMRMAGTPCPFQGEIGDDALTRWQQSPERMPDGVFDKTNGTTIKSNKNMEYRVWKKPEFCASYPEEQVCK